VNDVLPIFLEHGLLGACVIVLAVVVWRLFKALAKTQNDRVTEAHAVTDKLLEVSEKWLDAISAQGAESDKIVKAVDGVEKRVSEVLAAVQLHDHDTRGGHR